MTRDETPSAQIAFSVPMPPAPVRGDLAPPASWHSGRTARRNARPSSASAALRRACALEFGPAARIVRSPRQRSPVRGPVLDAGAGHELVARGAPVGNDQRHSARPRLGRDHAEGLGLAAVDQRVGAGESSASSLRSAIGGCTAADREPAASSSRRVPPRPVTDEQQADRTLARCQTATARITMSQRFSAEDARPRPAGCSTHRARARRAASGAAPPTGGRARTVRASTPIRTVSALVEAARAKSAREFAVGAKRRVEHPVEAAQMAPEPAEPAVDRRPARNPAEPAIGVSRERIGMHHQRPAGSALPAPDHGRARPGRRSFDMIGAPLVERPVQRPLVVEIAVAAIERQLRRRDCRDNRARTLFDHFGTIARARARPVSWPNRAAALSFAST